MHGRVHWKRTRWTCQPQDQTFLFVTTEERHKSLNLDSFFSEYSWGPRKLFPVKSRTITRQVSWDAQQPTFTTSTCPEYNALKPPHQPCLAQFWIASHCKEVRFFPRTASNAMLCYTLCVFHCIRFFCSCKIICVTTYSVFSELGTQVYLLGVSELVRFTDLGGTMARKPNKVKKSIWDFICGCSSPRTRDWFQS
jgi:hypothetical protein